MQLGVRNICLLIQSIPLSPGLTALIQEAAPEAIKEHDIKSFFGRKVAIDASMSLYQFLIAVRQNDGQQLMSDSGETTR